MKVSYYFVYILRCKNGAYYTGYTADLARRYKEHLQGTAKCKYTRSFKPISVVQSWQFDDKTVAMKVEKLVKQLNKKEKEKLIQFPERIKEYTNNG